MQPIVGRRVFGAGVEGEAECQRLVDDDGIFGKQGGESLRKRLGRDRAFRGLRHGDGGRRPGAEGVETARQSRERVRPILIRTRQDMHRAVGRVDAAGLAGIGEVGDRRDGVDEDQVLDAGEGRDPLIDRVGDAVDRIASATAFDPRVEGLGAETRASRGRDAMGIGQRIRVERVSRKQDECRFARVEGGIHRLDGLDVDNLRRRDRQGCGNNTALVPRRIRRQDQRRDVSGRDARDLDCLRRVGTDVFRPSGDARPPGYGARKTFRVGSKQRIERLVVGRLVADDVEERHTSALCIV